MSGEATYATVTPSVVEELRRIVGDQYVSTSADMRERYSHDEIPDPYYAHEPEVVVSPRTPGEIALIMQLANRERIPVTPRGAGSGLSGGAVPLHGGIVLLCDRQNEILDTDLDNMMVEVEPGVVTSQINAHLEGTGFFYAGYPMSLETCYIGGNVAENAGGGKAVKYGVTGRYVLGLEVVTPTGSIVRYGGKLVKDVTGYNMVQLMVGSEGTLGIFTRIWLRLTPVPKASVDLLVFFPTVEQAVGLVPRLLSRTGVVPTAVEFIDRDSFGRSCRYLNETLPWEDAGAVLILTVDGADEEEVTRQYETVGDLCEEEGADYVFVADNATTSERIWKVRRSIAESYALISPHQANEDLVVPPAAIPQLIAGMQEIAQRYDVFVPAYGHAGDGNIHTRIVKNPEWSMADWEKRLPTILDDLYALTARLGGRVSGEHGIGHKRKPYMDRFVSPEYLEVVRAIKRAVDPQLVLNPGKIFDA
ncbi:MAG: FAD-linked oxidase C-terminal domain-containing protein [Spirochaetia bacterium]